jgi:hypothetical protein
MAWRVQAANSTAPPEFTTIKTVWADPEIRNEAEIVANAKVLADMGLVEESLRQMATVFDWDEKKIQDLIKEKQAAEVSRLTALAGSQTMPNFSAVRGISLATNGGST